MEPGAEGHVTASLTVFGDALEFVVDERRLILQKTWEHLLLSGAALAIALAIGLPIAGSSIVHGNYAGVAALLIAGAGAAIGYAMRRGMTT